MLIRFFAFFVFGLPVAGCCAAGASLVVAAGAIGYLAEKKHDRNFATSLPAMLLGSTIIYAFGATWLSIHLNVPLANGEQNAINMGVAPFLVGDLLKALVAAGCTTSVWAAISKNK